MSKPKVFEKPTGVRDFLPAAVSRLRKIEFQVLQCMERWGYHQIITPTLEYYDTVGISSATEDKKLFKLLDRKGTTLVLRSDMTAPIARVVASLLKEMQFPIRLSYHSNVFRAFEDEAGRESEFFQTGVELVGDASPEADAEIIALAIACLQAAGVQNFKIAIGHIGFLTGLFNETLEGRDELQSQLKQYLLNRDYVGYREKINEVTSDPHVLKELEGILRLRGGQEICKQASVVTQDPLAQQSIRHLCEVWDALKDYGVIDHVMIDLTMLGDFSYYTGMTFEGYAADLGFPVCSGGRYDNLLKQFGRPAGATGFALKTNRILEIMSQSVPEEDIYKVLIQYSAGQRAEALRCAREMRGREGLMVVTRLLKGKEEDRSEPLPDGSVRCGDTVYQDVISFI